MDAMQAVRRVSVGSGIRLRSTGSAPDQSRIEARSLPSPERFNDTVFDERKVLSGVAARAHELCVGDDVGGDNGVQVGRHPCGQRCRQGSFGVIVTAIDSQRLLQQFRAAGCPHVAVEVEAAACLCFHTAEHACDHAQQRIAWAPTVPRNIPPEETGRRRRARLGRRR